MHGSIVRTIGIARAKTIPIIIGRDGSPHEIAKLLFHRMNLTYNICRCVQLKIVVAMGYLLPAGRGMSRRERGIFVSI
jgi:hypothetical protein